MLNLDGQAKCGQLPDDTAEVKETRPFSRRGIQRHRRVLVFSENLLNQFRESGSGTYFNERPDARRVHPETLVITIEERIPVGFVAGPVLEPVDREGHVLPLDPVEHRLDLPVLIRTGGRDALSPSQLRVLAMEVDRLAADDPTFMAAVSEMGIDDRGDATAVVSGDLLLRFRPPLSHLRLRDGLAALEDAVLRRPDQTAAVLDLRFEDQVVVGYAEPLAEPLSKAVGQRRNP